MMERFWLQEAKLPVTDAVSHHRSQKRCEPLRQTSLPLNASFAIRSPASDPAFTLLTPPLITPPLLTPPLTHYSHPHAEQQPALLGPGHVALVVEDAVDPAEILRRQTQRLAAQETRVRLLAKQ